MNSCFSNDIVFPRELWYFARMPPIKLVIDDGN
jgi:hypothetical protein